MFIDLYLDNGECICVNVFCIQRFYFDVGYWYIQYSNETTQKLTPHWEPIEDELKKHGLYATDIITEV